MVRKLTPRELRQRRATIKFGKIFTALSVGLWFLSSIPYIFIRVGTFLDNKGLLGEAPWTIKSKEMCGEQREKNAEGRVVVVTGANSGIGYEAAKTLALLNAEKVVLGCRSKGKCEYSKAMIDAERLELCFKGQEKDFTSNVIDPSLSLDLGDLDAVKKWAESLSAQEGVDYVTDLVLNAGIMSTPLEPRNPGTGLENQLHTNHVAHFYLTSLMLPLLESVSALEGAVKDSKVVTIASLAAQSPFSYSLSDINFTSGRSFSSLTAYSQSKRANLLFAQHLHSTLSPKGIKSLAAHPGYTRTNLFHNNWHFLPKQLDFIKDIASENTLFSMSSYDGAMMTVRSILDVNIPSGSYVTPAMYATGTPVVSRPKVSKWWNPGYKDGVIMYPFMENVWSWIWGGFSFKDEDVKGLNEFTEKVTGVKIE
ncbi:hypothetical protein TrVE_jg11321 [Triparma verrucosa]|uniref:NAD(P)-binding protein n=2 Tax=Triparma TaxID=722752 RepID=A0A9W7ALH6_9STRA|nr:hypothetical protein TrST_g5011 [Triparma strigata]GMH90598.1 hypothetical protein TrVE_jg11321 [Triparma verrucosa]